MVLGDSFPEKKKREYVTRSLVAGTIVRLRCLFTNPPKHKFLLLLSVDPVLRFFVINTRPNAFLLRNFPQQQIPITQSDYSFLSRDSTIDCSEPRSDLRLDDLRSAALANIGTIKGKITDRDRQAVRTAILQNRAIEQRVKLILSRDF